MEKALAQNCSICRNKYPGRRNYLIKQRHLPKMTHTAHQSKLHTRWQAALRGMWLERGIIKGAQVLDGKSTHTNIKK